jgi:hypothetical protein
MAFKKGQIGNPKGRGTETEKKRKTAELLLSPLVNTAVKRIEQSLHSEDRDDHQWAVDLIASYSWSKPKQDVDLKSDGNKIGILYVGTPPKPE